MATVSLQPATLDLSLYAGDAVGIAIEFVDKDTSLPWPVTGTWIAQVRSTPTAPTVVATFAIDMSQAAAGTLTLSLTPSDTNAIATIPAAGVWDLQQTPAAGVGPRTWFRGSCRAVTDVTR